MKSTSLRFFIKIEYLLTHKDKDDKSHFFNLLGYGLNEENEETLFEEMMGEADFSKMRFSKFNRFGLFVKVPTKISDRTKRRYIRIITIWRHDKKEQFHFITAIPRILED